MGVAQFGFRVAGRVGPLYQGSGFIGWKEGLGRCIRPLKRAANFDEFACLGFMGLVIAEIQSLRKVRHEREHRRCCANIILAAGREGLPETAVLDDEGWNSFGVFGEDAG